MLWQLESKCLKKCLKSRWSNAISIFHMGLLCFRKKESVSSVATVSLGRREETKRCCADIHMLRISKERERNYAVLCEWTAWNVFQDIPYAWDAVALPLVCECECETFHSNTACKYHRNAAISPSNSILSLWPEEDLWLNSGGIFTPAKIRTRQNKFHISLWCSFCFPFPFIPIQMNQRKW